MKIAGIIAEYNPFHNGHEYQIQKLRDKTNADYVIVVMSGNFVQRGFPALIDKYVRTEMALICGADLVIELPTLWATASAEQFARGGVSIFEQLGIVNYLGFGAEAEEEQLPVLLDLAQILREEPDEYKDYLQQEIRKGIAFPVARKNALIHYVLSSVDSAQAPSIRRTMGQYFHEPATISGKTASLMEQILAQPNNILAVEYLKALSTIQPVLIKRMGSGYHDTSLDDEYASASAIRNFFQPDADTKQLLRFIPEDAFSLLNSYKEHGTFLTDNSISEMLGYRLLTLRDQGYADFADCSEDLSNRIRNLLPQYRYFSQFCDLLKSKELTYTRISRTLLHILLDIRKEEYAFWHAADNVPYLRVLGFRKESSALLTQIKKETSTPLITKVADASSILSPAAMKVLQKDIFASDIYMQLLLKKSVITDPTNEYTHGVIIR